METLKFNGSDLILIGTVEAREHAVIRGELVIEAEAEHIALDRGRFRRCNVRQHSLRHVQVWLGIKSRSESLRRSVETAGWNLCYLEKDPEETIPD